MKKILKDIILENQYSETPEVFDRNIVIPFHTNKIVSLIGVRRSGKTYLLYKTIQKLLNSKVGFKQILFLNFEDERLRLNSSNLDQILQAYQELYPDIKMKDVYLFFDEIQNVEAWEKFIRRVYDTKTKHIFITGSNAKLLSSEIATELRGRSISYKVYPFNFNEYLGFQNIETSYHTQSQKSTLIHYTQKYITDGSFPELIDVKEHSIRTKILQEYFNVMLFREIIERYKVSNAESLKFFIKKIFANVTKPFSVNKAYNDLRSLGYKISNNYLYEFQDYCDTIFLTHSIPKFDFSEIKQSKSERKSYIIDNGLLASIEFSFSSNNGKKLENAVCMEFVKSGVELFYYKGSYECDFIIREMDRFIPIQVSYNMNDEDTKKRALRGLYEACKHLKTTNGIIITYDTELSLEYKDINVTIIPFYKYFL